MSKGEAIGECLCGTKIREGVDWEPGCRHCDRILLNRQVYELHEKY